MRREQAQAFFAAVAFLTGALFWATLLGLAAVFGGWYAAALAVWVLS
jgi:hypothetical protein